MNKKQTSPRVANKIDTNSTVNPYLYEYKKYNTETAKYEYTKIDLRAKYFFYIANGINRMVKKNKY